LAMLFWAGKGNQFEGLIGRGVFRVLAEEVGVRGGGRFDSIAAAGVGAFCVIRECRDNKHRGYLSNDELADILRVGKVWLHADGVLTEASAPCVCERGRTLLASAESSGWTRLRWTPQWACSAF